jgi:hypothetical protein
MLYREMSSVCSEIYRKHTDALYGKNVERWHERSGGVVVLYIKTLMATDTVKYQLQICTTKSIFCLYFCQKCAQFFSLQSILRNGLCLTSPITS